VKLVKCIAWDLDQTVWHGTLMEGDTPELRPGVREVIVELDRRGILNSVASYNDPEQAWGWLEQFGLTEYLVFPQIGWVRKPDAVHRIADTLQFATDTVAFIDDRPENLAEVTAALPEVRCYRPEDIAGLVSRPEFTPPEITPDAAQRRRRYQEGAARDTARQQFDGPDEEFLRSVRVELRIDRATPADLARLTELTARTTQMNTTGVYYSKDALAALLDDPAYELLVVSASDRFGDYGAVGVLLLRLDARLWHLLLLATSCRVVWFGAGTVILRWLEDQAARAAVNLVADFRASDRNRIMEIAYRFAGFAGAPDGVADGLPPAMAGVVRLHLRPERREPPAALQVVGVDLGCPQVTA
jgi:methoxymalonate biosynthesis protein